MQDSGPSLDPAWLGAAALSEAYRLGRLSPVEVTAALLRRIDRINPMVNALYVVDAEGAMAAAEASEARWRRGQPLDPLDGVPVTIKDSIKVRGLPIYRGCAANAGTPPSTADAPPAARLREAGAVILGKTTMPDLGILASGLSSQHGTTRNPWNLARNPGGSTSGGAAALAAGLGPLTVGSDLGGSIRIPAAFCGLVGFKPTQGRIPHLPASSMRSAGPLARSVADLALLTTLLARPDRRDYFSLAPEGLDYRELLRPAPRGLRLGLLLDLGAGQPASDEVKAAVTAAARLLEGLGHQVEPMASPYRDDPEWAVETFLRARALAEVETLPVERRDLLLPSVADWCLPAAALSGQDLMRAMAGLDRLREQVNEAFAPFDYVLSPVMATTAYGAEVSHPDPVKTWSHLHFTFAANQTQQPAIALPCGLDSQGLPIGLHIVGQRFDDAGLLRLAAAYEAARGRLAFPDEPRPGTAG